MTHILIITLESVDDRSYWCCFRFCSVRSPPLPPLPPPTTCYMQIYARGYNPNIVSFCFFIFPTILPCMQMHGDNPDIVSFCFVIFFAPILSYMQMHGVTILTLPVFVCSFFSANTVPHANAQGITVLTWSYAFLLRFFFF